MTEPNTGRGWQERPAAWLAEVLSGIVGEREPTLAEEVDGAVEAYRQRLALTTECGRVSLDFVAVRLIEAALTTVPLEQIRRIPAERLRATYTSCRLRIGIGWLTTFLRLAPATTDADSALARLERYVASAQCRSPQHPDARLHMALDIITKYELLQDGTRIGSKTKLMTSPSLRRRLLAPENSELLSDLCRDGESQNSCSHMLLRLLKGWLAIRPMRLQHGIGESTRGIIEARRGTGVPSPQAPIAVNRTASPKVCDLWDRATRHLRFMPTTPWSPYSMARARGMIRRGLFSHSTDGLPDFEALVEMARWLCTSPTPDDVESEILLWHLWRSHGDPSQFVNVYQEGECRSQPRMIGDHLQPDPTPAAWLPDYLARATGSQSTELADSMFDLMATEERIQNGCWESWDVLVDGFLHPYDGFDRKGRRRQYRHVRRMPIQPGHWDDAVRAFEVAISALD